MVQSGLRIQINSSLLSKFNPIPDQMTTIISENAIIIDRVQKEEQQEYDCTIFDLKEPKLNHLK